MDHPPQFPRPSDEPELMPEEVRYAPADELADLDEIMKEVDQIHREAAEPAASRPAPGARRLSRLRLLRPTLPRWVTWLAAGGTAVAVAALAVLYLLGIFPGRAGLPAFSLPLVEDFSAADLQRWIVHEGVWTLREDRLVQLANLEGPAQIYLPYEMPAEQPYHLSAYLILGRTTRAAGLNFNAQYPEPWARQHQVYIARATTTDEGLEGGEGEAAPLQLVAGFTDESGQFVQQVSVPFTLDTGQYRLDVYVLGNSYTVQLNGQTLIERRPLFYSGGLLGFVSQGTARFDTLKVTAAEVRDPGEQVYTSDFDQTPGGAGWVPLSGTWELSDGELVQTNPAIIDAAIGYEGSAFENYVVQATFRHLVGVGGGLLFNMVSPYQINSAYVVRYSEQADAVFWGFFDEQGIFTRQGYVDTAPAGREPHTLAVYVGVESYDIYLDDQLLARNVPLQALAPAQEPGRSGGHIGLITARSSVAYSLVEVFPLFDNAQMKLPRPQPLQSQSPASTPAQADATATPAASTVPAEPTPLPATPTARATRPPAPATPLPASSQTIVPGSLGWQSEFRGDLIGAGWRPISGQWQFSNGTLVQNDPNGIDLAIVYTGQAFQQYTYQVSFTHRTGHGAGILFNMPYQNQLAGAHMVRFSERRPGGIFWGYFDETGKFVGQGYANVTPPADARHTLQVASGQDSYSITLDGFLLAADVPLHQNYGYVGLVTVQSTASFDQIQVGDLVDLATATTTADPSVLALQLAPGAAVDTNASSDRRVLSGQWEIEEGVYRQISPAPADYILNTGVYASNYRIEATIALPVKPDAGGGFVLHMPERGRKNGASIVRLINGGTGLFWGVYDAAGTFLGRQSVELPPKPEGDNVFHLRVEVRGAEMDLFVDEVEIARGIQLPRSEGWVGLIAFGGPVTFTDLQITVAGIQ